MRHPWKTEHLLEAMGPDGVWAIQGTFLSSGAAQTQMRRWRELFPKLPLRVIEQRGGERIMHVCNDPRTDGEVLGL